MLAYKTDLGPVLEKMTDCMGTDKHYQIYRSVSAPFFYLFTQIPVPVFVRES